MKNTKIISIITALAIIAITVPVYALDIDLDTKIDTKIEHHDQKENSDKSMSDDHDKKSEFKADSHMRAWSINAGIIGKVTARTSDSITIKTSSGQVYTVSTVDTTVRHGSDNITSSAISVGDTVYVLGIKNNFSIAASTIVVGRSSDDVAPNKDEKHQAYFGIVTAKTDSSLTIKTRTNDVYIVNSTNAQIWINKTKQSSVSNFSVGDSVVVQGDLLGNNISAKKITAIHFPMGMITGKITTISGSTLTVEGFDNKTYTVVATDADIKVKRDKDADVSKLSVGSNIIVKGDVDGNNVTASSVTEGKIKIGFFHRIGLFFKGIFNNR